MKYNYLDKSTYIHTLYANISLKELWICCCFSFPGHLNVCRVDTNLNDEINPVWCFLENVRDHSNPRSGCFSDTTWSSRDGRFWSSEACKGLPPISDEGIDELPVSWSMFLKDASQWSACFNPFLDYLQTSSIHFIHLLKNH